MIRQEKKCAPVLFVTLVLGFTAQSAFAGSHTWDVNEVFSNADGTIQFVELQEKGGGTGEIAVTIHPIISTATGKSFTPGGDFVTAPTSNKHFLVATAAFAALPGAPTPDRIIPAGLVPFFVSTGADTVTYSPYDALAYPALPTDGINSYNDGTGVAVNSPTNYAGATGSVNAAGPTPGDGDGDGDVDNDDYVLLNDCFDGPDTAPTPTLQTEQECLDAFDNDQDNDIDLMDFQAFQAQFEV